MTYRESSEKLAAYRREIRELHEKMRSVQSTIEPEPVRDYVFRRVEGTVSLSELFGDNDTLFVIHNMGASCPYCTLWADGFNGVYEHLRSRASFVVASPDAPEKQRLFAQGRGWRFPMISVEDTSFAQDMGYWQDNRPMPGVSVFKRAGNRIQRVADTSFSPGDDFCTVWHFLDMIPEGADGWQPKYKYGDREEVKTGKTSPASRP